MWLGAPAESDATRPSTSAATAAASPAVAAPATATPAPRRSSRAPTKVKPPRKATASKLTSHSSTKTLHNINTVAERNTDHFTAGDDDLNDDDIIQKV